jgi:hypothetical protein
MDVDGALPDGQNGKKCQHIVSCNVMMLQALVPNTSKNLHNGFIVTVKPLRRKSSYQYKSSTRIYCATAPVLSYIMLFLSGKARKFSTCNIVNRRIVIISPLSNLTLVCNDVTVTRYVNDIMLLLFIPWLVRIYEIVSILPYEPYFTVSSNTECFRLNRYRE